MPLLAVGAVIARPSLTCWRYFSWANQTLAMIVLWTGAVPAQVRLSAQGVFHRDPPPSCVRGVRDLLLPGPECLGPVHRHRLSRGHRGRPVPGHLHLADLIVGKDDGPLHAAKN